MTLRKPERAPAAYDYPLLIKQLMHTPLNTEPRRAIRRALALEYGEFAETFMGPFQWYKYSGSREKRIGIK